ncbi:MAG: sugar phosphate isomerase/epimerase [Clostridiales bacterium]|jgi:sugar phosphate isomerase/epimerase|nr:sugar phosphate isomerase/epimerase [Clostridiales bacterium]
MKLSFSTLACPSYSIGKILDVARLNGYDGVELRAVRGTVNLYELDEFKGSSLHATGRKLKERGISVACLDTSVSFSDKESLQENLESFKKMLEIAYGLDAPYMRAFAGELKGANYDEAVIWIREGYLRISELLRDSGVCALLETHDDFSRSERVLDVLAPIQSDRLGVLWDIQHTLASGEKLEDTWNELGEQIKHLHIKDAQAPLFENSKPRLSGEGCVPIPQSVALLKSKGYDAYLSYEWEKMWHPEIEDPEIAIPHYAAYMKKLL